MSMKTLLTTLAAFTGFSIWTYAQIPPKPVTIPHHCDLIPALSSMKPTETVNDKNPIDLILVSKTDRKIYFLHEGKVTFVFTSAFGDGQGAKILEGDERTPEGTYFISSKNIHSDFHKSLGVSYPNAYDLSYAKKYNVSPGGAIMVHGMSNKITLAQNIIVANAINLTNWTQGCMAVRNDQIDSVFPFVNEGTPIEICPAKSHK